MQINTPQFKKKRGLSNTPKSFSNLHQSLRLNQIKCTIADSEIRKAANKTSKNLRLNHDRPIYELSLHDVTIDMSNSFKYIKEEYCKLNKKQSDATIYKMQHGFKKVFFDKNTIVH